MLDPTGRARLPSAVRLLERFPKVRLNPNCLHVWTTLTAAYIYESLVRL